MDPDGAQNQDRLCWREQAAIYSELQQNMATRVTTRNQECLCWREPVASYPTDRPDRRHSVVSRSLWLES